MKLSSLFAAAFSTTNHNWCFPVSHWAKNETFLEWAKEAVYLTCDQHATGCGFLSRSCVDLCKNAMASCSLTPNDARGLNQVKFDCVYDSLADECTPDCLTEDGTTSTLCGFIRFKPDLSTTEEPDIIDEGIDYKHKRATTTIVCGVAGTAAAGTILALGAYGLSAGGGGAAGGGTAGGGAAGSIGGGGTAGSAPSGGAASAAPNLPPVEPAIVESSAKKTGCIVGGALGSTGVVASIAASCLFRSESAASSSSLGATPLIDNTVYEKVIGLPAPIVPADYMDEGVVASPITPDDDDRSFGDLSHNNSYEDVEISLDDATISPPRYIETANRRRRAPAVIRSTERVFLRLPPRVDS